MILQGDMFTLTFIWLGHVFKF